MLVTCHRRLLFALLLAMLTLHPAAPAAAMRPTIVEFSFSVEDGPTLRPTRCDSFEVLISDTFTVRGTTFYDQAGNPVRATYHFTYSGTLKNSVTGETVPIAGRFSDTTDLQTGVETQAGLFYRVNLPGQGIVWLGAGKVYWDAEGNVTLVRGPNQMLEGDAQKICAALA
jgi:hypothetical protein